MKMDDGYSGLEKQASLVSEGGSCFNIARMQEPAAGCKPESDFRYHVLDSSASLLD